MSVRAGRQSVAVDVVYEIVAEEAVRRCSALHSTVGIPLALRIRYWHPPGGNLALKSTDTRVADPDQPSTVIALVVH